MSAPAATLSQLLAMRAAILARLSADAALAGLMGGRVRLHDEPPRGASPVYALFGDAEARDASVDGAARHAHSLALVVFAKPGSARTGLDAASRMAALLTEDALAPPGHVLVTCRVAALRATRDEASGEARAVLTLEAVTEAA